MEICVSNINKSTKYLNFNYLKWYIYFNFFKDSGKFVLLTFHNPLNRPPNNLKIWQQQNSLFKMNSNAKITPQATNLKPLNYNFKF